MSEAEAILSGIGMEFPDPPDEGKSAHALIATTEVRKIRESRRPTVYVRCAA